MSRRSEDALQEVNARRETWCRVESDGKLWVRAQRRHYAGPAHSRGGASVSVSVNAPGTEERCAWMNKPDACAQRRHFQQSYKSHLV